MASIVNKKIPKENQPKVAIVYSDTSDGSNESKHLATYLCGHLASTGYAQLYMVGMASDGIPNSNITGSSSMRITYLSQSEVNATKGKKVEIPGSDVTYSHFDILGECHIIIVTVNSEDTKMCRAKMSTLLDENRQNKNVAITIFAMQRGVRNSQAIKDSFTGRKGIAVIECCVGFSVIPHPKTNALVPTCKTPVIILERLDKDIEKIAIGPVNLIEYMGIEIYSRKQLTPYTWGVLLWENIHCINLLTGGTLYETICNTQARLVLASMMRECLLTLTKGAGSGKWKAELLVYSAWITPHTLELWLCLPSWLLFPLLWFWDMMPAKVMGSMLSDSLEGRRTCNNTQLGEILASGKRYDIDMPVCTAVHDIIDTHYDKAAQQGTGSIVRRTAVENLNAIDERASNLMREALLAAKQLKSAGTSTSGKKNDDSATSTSTGAAVTLTPKEEASLGIGKKSLRELRSVLLRGCLYAGMILIMYLLFVYEHEHEEMLEALPGHLDQEIL